MCVSRWPDFARRPLTTDTIQVSVNALDVRVPSLRLEISQKALGIENGNSMAVEAARIEVRFPLGVEFELVPFQIAQMRHIRAAGSFACDHRPAADAP